MNISELLKSTLRSQIEGYTRLLIFRKFSTLPAVIWASPFINFQENFLPPCFFTYSNEKFSNLPGVIRAYPPLIKYLIWIWRKIPVYPFIRASSCIRDLRVYGQSSVIFVVITIYSYNWFILGYLHWFGYHPFWRNNQQSYSGNPRC